MDWLILHGNNDIFFQITVAYTHENWQKTTKSAETNPGVVLTAEILVSLKKMKVSSNQRPIYTNLLRNSKVEVKLYQNTNENLNKFGNSAFIEPCKKQVLRKRN